MGEKRYALAGGLSIAQAIIFPLAFFMSIIQGIIGISAFGYRGPTFGPSDLLFIIFTAMSVYTLTMFRRLLHEYFDFHAIDTLITIAIIWNVLFQILSLAVRGVLFVLWPVPEIVTAIVYISFMTVTMVVAGVVNILIAVKILKVKDTFNDLIRAFGYVTMAAGILQSTIILSPLALILAPVLSVILAIIFLRDKENVEFV